jgi:hypothetical protein
MSKKQPLYAPMLATFGGGSVRGFTPGGGGGGTLEFDKYGELPSSPTTFSKVWNIGTGSSQPDSANNAQNQGSGAICFSDNPALFNEHGAIIVPNSVDKPSYLRPKANKQWSDMTSSNDAEMLAFGLDASNGSGQLSMGVTYYSDTTSHYCFGSRVSYDRYDGSGIQSRIRSYYAQDVTSTRDMGNQDFKMEPGSQRFGSVMNSLDPFYSTAAKDQAGAFFGTGQQTMHMHMDFDPSVTTNPLDNQFNQRQAIEAGFASIASQNTHGNVARGVFLGGKKDSQGNSNSYYMAQYNNHSGGVDGYQTYKLYYGGTTASMTINSSGHIPTYRNGDPFEVNANSSDQINTLPSKFPYAFHCYNSAGTLYTNVHDLSSSGTVETSTGIRPHNISSNGHHKNLAAIHNNSGTLTILYHQGSNYYTATVDPSSTSTGSLQSVTQVLSSSLSHVYGIRPIPGTNRLVAVGVNSAELIEVS